MVRMVRWTYVSGFTILQEKSVIWHVHYFRDVLFVMLGPPFIGRHSAFIWTVSLDSTRNDASHGFVSLGQGGRIGCKGFDKCIRWSLVSYVQWKS
jgi:hypothetical protein